MSLGGAHRSDVNGRVGPSGGRVDESTTKQPATGGSTTGEAAVLRGGVCDVDSLAMIDDEDDVAQAMEDVFVVAEACEVARANRQEAERADREARPVVPLPGFGPKLTLRERSALRKKQRAYDPGLTGVEVVKAMQMEVAATQLWALAVERLAGMVSIDDEELVAEIEGRTWLGPGGWGREESTDWVEFVSQTFPYEPFAWWSIDDGMPYEIPGWGVAA